MKNDIEISNKINNLSFMELLNFKEKIDVNKLANLSLEISDVSERLDFEKINKQMFKYNNQFNKTIKNYNLDMQSYNLGVLEMFLKMLLFIEAKNKSENHVKSLQSLNKIQKQIIDIIYKNDGIDSKTLREKIQISSQYLYNLTHTNKLNNLINIYGSENEKNKHYTLTASCRAYLDKDKRNKNVRIIISPVLSDTKKEFYSNKIDYYNDFNTIGENKKTKEENYGISKIIGYNNFI